MAKTSFQTKPNKQKSWQSTCTKTCYSRRRRGLHARNDQDMQCSCCNISCNINHVALLHGPKRSASASHSVCSESMRAVCICFKRQARKGKQSVTNKLPKQHLSRQAEQLRNFCCRTLSNDACPACFEQAADLFGQNAHKYASKQAHLNALTKIVGHYLSNLLS